MLFDNDAPVRIEKNIKYKHINYGVELTNDFTVTSMGFKTVYINSVKLNFSFEISHINFMDIINTSKIENGHLEGKFIPIKYGSEVYLIKEGSKEYKLAKKNSEKKKPTLKVGHKYTLKIKGRNAKDLFSDQVISNNTEFIFAGSFKKVSMGGIFSKDNVTFNLRENTQVFYLEKTKQFAYFSVRNHFEITEDIGTKSSFLDKIVNESLINQKAFERYKNNKKSICLYFENNNRIKAVYKEEKGIFNALKKDLEEKSINYSLSRDMSYLVGEM